MFVLDGSLFLLAGLLFSFAFVLLVVFVLLGFPLFFSVVFLDVDGM